MIDRSQRRRSADDSIIVESNRSINEKNDFESIDDLDQLKEIIRGQSNYLQQLQTRIRLTTPDLIQSPSVEKLTEENRVSPKKRALPTDRSIDRRHRVEFNDGDRKLSNGIEFNSN